MIISIPDHHEREASIVCHSYILTKLLIIRAGPDPRSYLNSTRKLGKVRDMKSVDLVTSPEYSSTPVGCVG